MSRAAAMIAVAATCLVAEVPSAPGRLVDVGGHKLHLHCSGEGSPTVVLESGFPGSSLDWSLVQPQLARVTRVCSYDRAGFGWSEASSAPVGLGQIVNELSALLQAAEIGGPYVLVGHSLGGLYARHFTRRYPDRVAGLVLVDATHEDQWDYEIQLPWESSVSMSKRPEPPPVQRPPDVQRILSEMWKTETWKAAEKRERAGIGALIAEMQKSPKRLPAIPLVVLSAGDRVEWLETAPAGAWKGQQLQLELAALSARGQWVPVAGANHYIHLSKPEAVVDAISRTVQAARQLRPAQK